MLSDSHIKAARAAVLDLFDAPSHEYVCVFTTNATGALKLVGEAYPFSNRSSYVLPADCHNSVNGIRRFAHSAGAEVQYLEALHHGGFDEAKMRVRAKCQGTLPSG
jgi:molybdenum cofactor sulfurtransferase